MGDQLATQYLGRGYEVNDGDDVGKGNLWMPKGMNFLEACATVIFGETPPLPPIHDYVVYERPLNIKMALLIVLLIMMVNGDTEDDDDVADDAGADDGDVADADDDVHTH